jgi:hypothetical protein
MTFVKQVIEAYFLWYFIVSVQTPTCLAQVVKPGRTPATRAALFQNFASIRARYESASAADRSYPFALVFRNGIHGGTSFSTYCAKALNTDPFSQEVVIQPVPHCGAENYENMRIWRTYKDWGGGRHWEMRRDADVPGMDFYHRNGDGWVNREMWKPGTLRQVQSPVVGLAWVMRSCILKSPEWCPNSDFNSLDIDVLACNVGYDIGRNGCENINECSEIHECPANSDCTDTEGDYRCTCKTGTLIVL